jgi:LysM repeat protein
MKTKRVFQVLMLGIILAGTLIPTAAAAAWSGCGASYTVQSGDTLGSIAGRCGTSVAALRMANPNLGYWIYAGQVLWLPGSSVSAGNGSSVYIVARGDTLRSLANRFGTTVAALASLNGIYDYNLIYEGQRLVIPNGSPAPNPYPQPGPVSSGTYVVQWGDTMRKIAARFDVSLSDLLAVNPQIPNPNLIFFGQVVNIPGSASTYTIQRGDTMRLIAARYGTSVDSLLGLNPQIWNANWIYAGQTIRVR